MRAVRSQNTTPELRVRQALRDLGFTGYRLHRKDLPGKPDVAFVGRKKAIFVHGCFWHGHDCVRGAKVPSTNTSYWVKKISRNWQRDAEQLSELKSSDWSVLVIWECELKNSRSLMERLSRFMGQDSR